ncbi:MAG: hypothetical protein IIT81_01435 [Mycoplasmataceae bacterium]|nr:hypothetical protein [Mycoplasmataceae bacterium]
MNKLLFEEWFLTLRNQENDFYGFDYFINWNKVYKQLDIKELVICLNMLDSLKEAHNSNINEMFIKILHMCKEVKKYLPLLLAANTINNTKWNLIDKSTGIIYHYDFNNLDELDENSLCILMQKVGLFDLYLNHLSDSTLDYVTGALAGLSSNGRKNRSGKDMEEYIKKYLENNLKINQDFYYQIKGSSFKELFNIEIKQFDNRTFDFVLYNKNSNQIFIIEVNYYHTSGSKLSKVCADYITLNDEINQLNNNCYFIWITDGPGWEQDQLRLKEAYQKINYLLNIQDIDNGKLMQIYNKSVKLNNNKIKLKDSNN